MTSPPGRFLLLGSGEFEPWAGEAERFAMAGALGDGSVAVLATASGRERETTFDRWTDMGLAHYASLGIAATPVRVRNRADALASGVADPLESASMVFFSGGSPAYLAATIVGTPIWDGVLRLVARGGVFAGCSAGAMVAGAGSPPGRNGRLPFPFASGLGLVPNIAVGVHWDALSGWWIRPPAGLTCSRQMSCSFDDVPRVHRGIRGDRRSNAGSRRGAATRAHGC